MGTTASQITSLTIVYSTVYSDVDQRKHQSSASLAFVWGIHRGPVNSPHKWPVTRKMCPFDDVIRFRETYSQIRRYHRKCKRGCARFVENYVVYYVRMMKYTMMTIDKVCYGEKNMAGEYLHHRCFAIFFTMDVFYL